MVTGLWRVGGVGGHGGKSTGRVQARARCWDESVMSPVPRVARLDKHRISILRPLGWAVTEETTDFGPSSFHLETGKSRSFECEFWLALRRQPDCKARPASRGDR